MLLLDEVTASPAALQEARDCLTTEDLRRAFVVRCQNVFDYAKETFLTTHKNLQDFPNTAPPMDRIWFEWTDQGEGIDRSTGALCRGNIRVGILVASVDMQASDPEFEQMVRETYRKGKSAGWDSFRWACGGFVFTRIAENGWLPRFFGGVQWGVAPDGQLVPSAIGEKFAYNLNSHLKTTAENDDRLLDTLMLAVETAWLAISFMHCRNVRLEQGPLPPPKLQKARQRRGKLPLLRWHTLTIESVKEIVSAANGGNAALTPAALHICRGHFKNFQERGLFGRHHGMFWWPMHARGRAERGIVLKDYEVKAGAAQPLAVE